MANLDGIKVNHGSLELAVTDLQDAMKKIEGRMTTLEGELEPLKSQWAGNAQQAYTIAKKQWDDAIFEMHQLLNDTQLAVGNSNAEYRAADLRGAKAFGG